MSKAKRGDLVLVEYRPDAMGEQYPNTFCLERVTSVTRDGWVKRTSRVGYKVESEEEFFRVQIDHGRSFKRWRCYYVNHMVVLASTVDAAAMWTAWLARQPENGWQPEPFRSLEEAREFAQPFRRQAVA